MFVPISPGSEAKAGFGPNSQYAISSIWKDGSWGDLQLLEIDNLPKIPITSNTPNYGMSVFEGMKAHEDAQGLIRVFRALTHFDRFSQSLDRMALPALSQELFFKSLEMLLSGDAKKSLNVDFKGGQCLYLRPIICNATNKLGPVMSEEFHFALFTAPLLINPYGEVKLMIETEKSRAAKGGVATAKTAGNYAAGAKVVIDAQKKGYKHVAFTDASSHLYFEECGSTNLYFIWNGKIVTPSLDEGTILNGVTRRTILEVVAPDLGLQVEERKVFVQEVRHAILDKDITEVFVSGTACTNTPVVGISYKGLEYDLPPYHNDSITFQIHRAMNAIYVGETHIGLTAGHVY